jgi:hypothetical protein
VAVNSDAGKVSISDTPGTWASGSIAKNGFTSVACPTASLCLLASADKAGQLLISTHASTQKSAWHTDSLPHGASAIDWVACASAGACFAEAGKTYVTFNPGAAHPKWVRANIPFTGPDASAAFPPSCPTASECFATDERGEVLVGTKG